jgi:type II secretion system protein D
LCLISLDSALAAPTPRSSRQADKPDKSDADPADDDAADKHVFRINYVDASWSKVLKEFAEATQTTLVADTVPTKKFSRWDLKRHSRADSLKILNQALQPENYRLQFKGQYLILNHLKDFRHDYPAAVLRGDSREEPKPDSGVKTAAGQKETRKQNKGAVRHASGEVEEGSTSTRETAQAVPAEPIETTVKLKSRDALSISKIMYKAFKPNVEEVDDGDGPQGLRGFLVRRQLAKGAAAESDDLPVQFSVGMDRNKNHLVVKASPQESKSIIRLIRTIDTAPKNSQTAVRAVKTTKDAGKIALALQPQLDRLSGATRKNVKTKARLDGEDDGQDGDLNSEANEPEPEQPRQRSSTRRGAARGEAQDAGKSGSPQALLGSLKGEVRVESVPELGILVITGNQNDVEAVQEVIQEIERLSKGTAPEVRLALLRHVSSEALAALLTAVYERLGNVRNSAVQQSQAISVFPVSRPNAVLVVASKIDMDNVFNLIDDLDQPSDPETEFMVYRLKFAIPGHIVDKVEALFPPQQQAAGANQQGTVGLLPRVRIIDDVRTNSVIVQARPRDMREVVAMIKELDVNDSDSQHQIKIFPLNYAVADEVAFTVQSSIQNVLGQARATAPTTGQPGAGQAGQFGANQQGGAAGAGQGASELREIKSTILQFLDEDGQQGRQLRSGIVSDIRMTADLRTNSIVVTAPLESMDFVAMLIKRLDKPSAMTAEIKVFKLKNADATSVQTLLERLFGIQRTGQQGGQGGQQAGVGQVPGLLMADSEDSSSMLIPLRFSVDARTNSVIAIGGGGALTVVEAVVLQLDATDIPQRQNEVYRLKMNTAAAVATAISQFLQTQLQALQAQDSIISPFEQIEREVIVVPEPVSNSLLISATPRYFKDIKELIIKLDRTPQQVLIQALIVEVQLTNTDEFGMELGLQDSVLFRRSGIPAPVTVSTVSQNATGAQLQTQNIISESANPGYLFNGAATQLGNNTFSGASNPSNIAGQALTGFGTALSNAQLGYGGLVLQAGSENINFLLRALAARVRIDVLSRPQVRALDNQPARIQVGKEIPRINGFTANGTTGVNSPIIEQRPIGIILDVTPRISPDGLVIMVVQARKDALDPNSVSLGTGAAGSTITSPIVDTTNAQSTLAVNSGQTVIMGGMITKSDDVEERKVPILGDIPILGRAFRYDYKQMIRTELLIFLTPRIIKNDDEAEMFKQIEMERMNFIESEAERMHGPLFGMSENCPPGTDPGSVVPPPSSDPSTRSGPALEPRPERMQPLPPAPKIPGSASRTKNREPHAMPVVDDDEDLDAGLIQTGYRVPQDVGSAPNKTKPAKSSSKSPKEPAKKASVKNEKAPAKTPVKLKSPNASDAKKPAPRTESDDS